MKPLRVQARIRGAIAMPHGPIALDSLLAAQVALRDGIPPAMRPEDVVPIEIPVQREPKGRFHLASFSVAQIERHRLHRINRRFPVEEAQMFGGPRLRRFSTKSKRTKSFRLPLDTVYLVDDMLTWWCVGDEAEVRSLVEMCMGLGKKRAVGLGQVAEWLVEPCDTWDGFPVVLNGQALRNLPLDWPGLKDPNMGYGNLTYPYTAQLNPNECEIAVP
jgi:CRISPR type IV-associated protein Csf3